MINDIDDCNCIMCGVYFLVLGTIESSSLGALYPFVDGFPRAITYAATFLRTEAYIASSRVAFRYHNVNSSFLFQVLKRTKCDA